MPRWGIAAAVAIGGLLVASQLLLPGIGERDVEDRLTEHGGEAEVNLSAFPAVRLLFDDGGSFEVRARDLELDIDERAGVFDSLDGFADVDVTIADSTAGPFEIETFELTRSGSGPYRLLSRSEASPAELVDFGADRLGIPGGNLLGGIAGTALSDEPVPIVLDSELVSDDGDIEVVSGGGTVAGIPTGPLGEAITAAVVSQL
jgi:hypothetical protein